MPHPIMFRDDDPGLAELRRIALGFPEAFEKVSWGRPVFCAPKMFVMYGGSRKIVGDTGRGEMQPYPHSVLVKVDEAERPALQADPRFFHPAYLGPSGWLGLNLSAAAVDWTEVAELVDASYRLVVPRRLIRILDEQRGDDPA
ncbi:MmcQ/YjbR family DNA-binding protein [Mycolicibacterium thermoresistibile]